MGFLTYLLGDAIMFYLISEIIVNDIRGDLINNPEVYMLALNLSMWI